MSWFKKLISRGGEPPRSEEEAHVLALLDEVRNRASSQHGYWSGNFDGLTMFPVIRDAERDQQARHVAYLVIHLQKLDHQAEVFKGTDLNPHLKKGWNEIWMPRMCLGETLQLLLKKKLPLSIDTVKRMLGWVADRATDITHIYPLGGLVAAIEDALQAGEPIKTFSRDLGKLSDGLQWHSADTSVRRILNRIRELLGSTGELPIIAGEAWSDAAIEDLNNLASGRTEWIHLLTHCSTVTGGTPTKKWILETEALIAELPRETLLRFIPRWFALADKKRTQPALTEKEWIRRCAYRSYDTLYTRISDRLSGRDSYRQISRIRDVMLRSKDPWHYLVHLNEQKEFRSMVGDDFPALDFPESPPPYDPEEDQLIIQPHMDLLCGLAWACGTLHDPAIARALSLFAVSAFRKVAGTGPRAIRVGNGCITGLGMMGTSEALGRLAFLKVKVKFGGAQKTIDKALEKLAGKLGVSREDLEEMSVPSYGLEEVGKLTQRFGDHTAVITIVSSRATELVWLRPDGKPQKSIPAAAKSGHGDDLKELMARKKDIERMLPAQAERLDNLYLQRKNWPIATWRERYLDHPLVGTLARRLIWSFRQNGGINAAIWKNDELVDWKGNAIGIDEANAVVALWHPLDSIHEEVIGWRDFLEASEIVQPFKQAHREIYRVAPAEETTGVYSNRFAAHLLRQHQFHALCAARGWRNRLRLMVDDAYPPATRWLDAWDLRAEYWVEGAGTDYGTDTLESGAYRYLSTDQVRFYQTGAHQVTAHAGGGGYEINTFATRAEPLRLATIDPLVFSEVMRDVDLFVGVASVGNDPNWLDNGPNERQREYWNTHSFGELSASASTRKEILERLVPKLKIAAQCSFGDNFLIVQGKRHRYKIHLGSSNILIDPQAQYLCIVPAQSQVDKAGGKIFLPFEGDKTLSVIISKAFLLAADDKITDQTILRQLPRKS